MKRRVISLITSLTLCLSLCPTWTLAADLEPDTGLCAHHQVHTQECGYAPPMSGADCAHEHDDNCFTVEISCVHEHTEDCYPQPDSEQDSDSDPEPSLCGHECSEDSGCVTLTPDCAHVHDETCGYAEEDEGTPCMFVCRICPVEALIDELPSSVTPDNKSQVEDQLNAILELYTELTEEEQEQLDLSRCLDLQSQLYEDNTPSLLDGSSADSQLVNGIIFKENTELANGLTIRDESPINTGKYTLTVSKATAIIVADGGKVYIMGTMVTSKAAAGVEVQKGGSLYIEDPNLTVSGKTYGLDIASGAKVELSGGTYTGGTAAIRTAGDDFAALRKTGYAYFDADGNLIPPAEMAAAKTVVIKECDSHSYDDYTHNDGTPTHTGTCTACGNSMTGKCTFIKGKTECEYCGVSINISVDESDLGDLVYDSEDKTANVSLTVTLDGTELNEGTDYTVSHTTRADVGEITVTVTGITYNGEFTKTYNVTQDKPAIKWDNTACSVNYDGSPVEKTDLSDITITIKDPNTEDLSGLLKYSYRPYIENDDTGAFTDGLPTNAGDYEIKASLPEQTNYEAAETNPCLKLTINKIDALKTAPVATQPKYNRDSQNLVTAGALHDLAAAEGAVIKFKLGENGEYSADIPTGINAGDYRVWYKVEATGNYNVVGETEIPNVKIEPKPITPTIILQESYVFDGSKKDPRITVRDGQTVIEDNQYKITWDNDLKSAGTHTATIASTGLNYAFEDVERQVEIEPAAQNALSITGKPSDVYYGDIIKTLATSGGTENGTVKWSVVSGAAKINETGNKLEITGIGEIKVKAERTVENYKPVEDIWTFTAEPKPVTAVVTVDNKTYDRNNTAIITEAKIAVADLVKPTDAVTIDKTKLVAEFDDVNAGTNKTVTLKIIGAAANGDDADKYKISYPETVKADITAKTVDNPTIELSGYTFSYDGNEKRPTVVKVTITDGETVILIPSSEYTPVYSNNIEVSADGVEATVTITDNEGGNYYIVSGSTTFKIIASRAELTRAPAIKDLTYIKGIKQELVTDGTAANGKVVYSDKEEGPYVDSIPKGENADTYTVWYKVKGDDGYIDTTPRSVQVTIKPKEVTSPVITLGSYNKEYDGSAKEPGVTKVEDDGTEIPASEYTVDYSRNTNAGIATVNVRNANGGNYIVNGTADFTIERAAATVNAPNGKENLPYNGTAQELISRGSSPHGKMVYALDGADFSEEVPTGTAVHSYTVSYKVLGDDNHKDSEVGTVPASIIKNTVDNPTIDLSPGKVTFNGIQQKPTITVKDDKGILIDESEYVVDYGGDMVDVGEYTVKITTNENSNYVIIQNNTRPFEILEADQETISITGMRDQVYYGDIIQLGTTGGTGNGTVEWSVTGDESVIGDTNNPLIKIDSSSGLLTVKNVGGPITVTAKRTAGGNYKDMSATWEFYASKKPVTAVLTGVDIIYAEGKTTTDVEAEVKTGDLVSGDSISITGLKGRFDDENVGVDKKITIYSDPTVEGTNSDKYDITIPNTATASILKADTAGPNVKPNSLIYSGEAQDLVTGGVEEETLYSETRDGVYTTTVPTGKNAGTYDVWYKAPGDANHNESEPKPCRVTIAPKTVNNPTIELSGYTFSYDGSEKRPTVVKVTITDGETVILIPSSEYTAIYSNNIEVSTEDAKATVTIVDNEGGNYIVSGSEYFEIIASDQNPLTIVTDKHDDVYYGDSFRLSATGGSGNGAIQWSIEGSGAEITNDGVVTVKAGTGTFTVKAYRAADGSFGESNTDSVTFNANPKPITPDVAAKDKNYDREKDATLIVSWKDGDIERNDNITVDLTKVKGEFATADVGINKQVWITADLDAVTGAGNYDIKWPTFTTASIYKVDAKLANSPKPKTGLVYDKNDHYLLESGGTTKDSIGTVEYSLREKGEYSTDIPVAKDAGKHEVWYRVADSANYNGIAPVSIEVTIDKATPAINVSLTASPIISGHPLSESTLTVEGTNVVPGSFAWTNGDTIPVNGQEYEVTFTPNDTKNYNTSTISVIVTVEDTGNEDEGGETGPTDNEDEGDTGGAGDITNEPLITAESGTVSAPMQASVRNGTATSVLSASAGSSLVKAAAANQSKNVVIKPEITGDVTKTEVSIPASTVSQLKSETDADLTVSTPIANVTIPNASLDTLSSAGGTVSVATEQKSENAIALTLTADGKRIDEVPGGVTLTVPVEEALPGTVAVVVHEDGTRETIRKAVPENGELNVPLSGSATVEIVDNSKEYADVSATDWEADAVAFASAHELFNGTSETTFSPDQPMSRAMLTTVLYNLEGRPALSSMGEFSDVSSDAWYASGVSWATENGITNGYEDGQFGPDENVTREQFAVMLWRYAGSPASDGQVLGFTDADQVSDYAEEALRWATAKGILSGGGDGRLNPGGLATRAEAAQMLKNFMENT